MSFALLCSLGGCNCNPTENPEAAESSPENAPWHPEAEATALSFSEGEHLLAPVRLGESDWQVPRWSSEPEGVRVHLGEVQRTLPQNSRVTAVFRGEQGIPSLAFSTRHDRGWRLRSIPLVGEAEAIAPEAAPDPAAGATEAPAAEGTSDAPPSTAPTPEEIGEAPVFVGEVTGPLFGFAPRRDLRATSARGLMVMEGNITSYAMYNGTSVNLVGTVPSQARAASFAQRGSHVAFVSWLPPEAEAPTDRFQAQGLRVNAPPAQLIVDVPEGAAPGGSLSISPAGQLFFITAGEPQLMVMAREAHGPTRLAHEGVLQATLSIGCQSTPWAALLEQHGETQKLRLFSVQPSAAADEGEAPTPRYPAEATGDVIWTGDVGEEPSLAITCGTRNAALLLQGRSGAQLLMLPYPE